MSVSARFLTSVARVDPGGETVVSLQVRNTSTVVEAYRFEAVGIPPDWVSFNPETLSLYPGSDGQSEVRIAPPRQHDVPVGQVPFGVRVVPSQRPDDGVLPEGLLEISPFAESGAELVPRNSSARRTARHEVAVDNRGNAALTVQLRAYDADELLAFDVRPDRLEVPPGTARFAKVKVRTRKLAWTGQPASRPFQIDVRQPGDDPAAGPPMQLDGTMLQNPVFSRWTMRAALAALGVAVGLVALWFGLLRPTIQSAAEDAVAKPVQEARQEAVKAQSAAKDAELVKDETTTAADKVADAATKLDPETVAGLAGAPNAVPLRVSAGGGGSAQDGLDVADGRRYEITDILLQNPQGDSGMLTLSVGDTVLLRSALANFRDLDYHFVTPIRVDGGQSFVMELACGEPGEEGNGTCNVSALIGGVTRKVKQSS